MRELLATDRARGFDPSRAPLMRLTLVRLSEGSSRLIWNHHQMMLDGWSVPQVLGDVSALYGALRRGEAIRLEPSRPYRDYLVWLKRQDLAKAEEFWRASLRGISAPTPVPVRRAVGAPETGSHHQILLTAEATAELQALARRHQLTLNTLVQGAWGLLLSRYSTEPSVVFGAVVSGRPADLAGVESIVGLFINTLPVRLDVDPMERLLPWLQRLQGRQIELRGYEYSPLTQIQRWSEIPAGQPLFLSMLAFQNHLQDMSGNEETTGLNGRLEETAEKTNYPLTVVAQPGTPLSLMIEYDARLFDEPAVARMLGHCESLLRGMAARPEGALRDLPLLAGAERQQLLVEWAATQVDFPRGRTIHRLFEERAAQTPDAPAALVMGRAVSYA